MSADPFQEDRHTYPPYKAGRWLQAGASYDNCTSSFVIHNGYGTFGSTAGHCGTVGTSIKINGSSVGQVNGNGFFNDDGVDAGIFLINSANMQPYVYLGTGTAGRPVRGQVDDNQMANGQVVCFQGLHSGGGNCGAIFEFAVDTFGFGHTAHNNVCFSHSSGPGDSGGPVYRTDDAASPPSAIAAGHVSGSRNPSSEECFTTIDHTLNEFSATIVTAK